MTSLIRKFSHELCCDVIILTCVINCICSSRISRAFWCYPDYRIQIRFGWDYLLIFDLLRLRTARLALYVVFFSQPFRYLQSNITNYLAIKVSTPGCQFIVLLLLIRNVLLFYVWINYQTFPDWKHYVSANIMTSETTPQSTPTSDASVDEKLKTFG